MLISIQHKTDSHIISLEGDLDAIAVEDVRRIFSDILENYVENVAIDMSDVAYMDSSGLGSLVYLYKRLYANSRHMALIGLKQQPKDMIELLRMHKTIETFADIKDYMQKKPDGDRNYV